MNKKKIKNMEGQTIFSGEDESLKDCVQSAVKSGANLSDANLSGAYLSGAYLTRANLSGALIETGETWEQYLQEVVPALIAAGGHPVSPQAWACHTWRNCPMAEAFGVHSITEVPVLLRPRAAQFLHFFDAGLIPAPPKGA